MSYPPYATPSDFWQLAAPPDSLFEENGFEPGQISSIVQTGPGLGSLTIGSGSNPRDSWSVVVKCVRSGEVNTPYVNPGPLPQFQLSLDGGLTYLWPVYEPSEILQEGAAPTTQTPSIIKIQKGGFSLILKNGTVGNAVTVGAGNAALVFTPKQAGGSVVITVGSSLTHTFFNGALSLTVTNATTATQAAAYLNGFSAITDYYSVVAGGTGAGVVQAATLTPFPFQSFVANTTWAFTTQPSIDVVAALQMQSDYMNGYLSESFTLPLQEWGNDIRFACCVFARWSLLVRRGLDPKQDFKVYDPAGPLGTQAWLEKVANGNVRPVVKESPPATLFPLLIQQQDPLDYVALPYVFPI